VILLLVSMALADDRPVIRGDDIPIVGELTGAVVLQQPIDVAAGLPVLSDLDRSFVPAVVASVEQPVFMQVPEAP
jgi:hypothetical protein